MSSSKKAHVVVSLYHHNSESTKSPTNTELSVRSYDVEESYCDSAAASYVQSGYKITNASLGEPEFVQVPRLVKESEPYAIVVTSIVEVMMSVCTNVKSTIAFPTL